MLVKGFQVRVRSGEKVMTGERVTSHVKWWSLVHLKPNIKILLSSHVLSVQKSHACHTSMFFFFKVTNQLVIIVVENNCW